MHGLARIGILHAMTPAAAQQALVIATFSQRMRLRLDDDSEVVGRLKGKKMRPVCGDEVMAEPIENEPEWLITDILPRRNELSRPDRRGRAEVLAANIDLVTVVSTDAPATDWFIVDRYLAAAELIDVPALVVFNKTDLGAASEKSAAELQYLMNIGYATVRGSAKTGDNMDELQKHFHNKTAIIVGQRQIEPDQFPGQGCRSANRQTFAKHGRGPAYDGQLRDVVPSWWRRTNRLAGGA
jgi:ribosome biogenesis GTPase